MTENCNTKYQQSIVDGLRDPVIVVDKNFTIRFMNRAAKASLPNSADAAGAPRACYEVAHGYSRPCRNAGEICPADEVFKTGRHARVIHHHLDDDGKQRTIEVSASPLFDDGDVREVVEVMRDVTDRRLAERLQGSEQRFTNLLEAAHDAILTMNAGGTILYSNGSTERIFGYGFTELTGKHISMLMPKQPQEVPDGVHGGPDAFQQYTRTGRTVEASGQRKDGTEIPVELSLSTWSAEGKKYVTAIIRDISERKRSEELVRQSRAELQRKHEELTRTFKLVEIGKREWEKTMDCVADLVILADGNGNIKRCNKAVTAFTGRPYDRLLGKSWRALLAEEGLQVEGPHGEKSGLFHERTGRWFVMNTYAVLGIIDEQAYGAVISLHDTTDLKRITMQLESTNREINDHRSSLQSALDELSSLLQRVEEEKTFHIRFTNPNLKKCFEIKNCSLRECPCHGKDIMRCWQIAGTLCGGKVQGTFAQKYGNCTECDVFKTAASNPIYQIGEHFNNMMHILELKNKELEDAYTELKFTQSQILQQEKMASIGLLAAGVAHEINNPIGFISSNLGTLGKYVDKITGYAGALTEAMERLNNTGAVEAVQEARVRQRFDFIVEDVKKLIAESLDGADRVKTIVQNLKNFARVDQSEAKYADLNECLETTINIAWNELKYKTTLKKEYGKLPLVKCFPQQLNQVFMNLLVNAAHAIDKQGNIIVRTWEQEGAIFITVADTGCGIPPQNLSKIFEPFFTTKEVGKGTGLGLSIAYDIVKKHDGDISVQSKPGKGSTFTVRIPAADKRD